MIECANAPGMDALCEANARLGLCNTDRTLLDTCRLSCTRCGPLPSNVSGMLSTHFNTSQSSFSQLLTGLHNLTDIKGQLQRKFFFNFNK